MHIGGSMVPHQAQSRCGGGPGGGGKRLMVQKTGKLMENWGMVGKYLYNKWKNTDMIMVVELMVFGSLEEGRGGGEGDGGTC